MLHTYSTMPCPSRGLATVLAVVLLSRNRPALRVQPVVRLHSLAGREDASVNAVSNNRTVNPPLIRRQSSNLRTRERTIGDAVPDTSGLGDLTVLHGGLGSKRHTGAEGQAASRHGEPIGDSFHLLSPSYPASLDGCRPAAPFTSLKLTASAKVAPPRKKLRRHETPIRYRLSAILGRSEPSVPCPA